MEEKIINFLIENKETYQFDFKDISTLEEQIILWKYECSFDIKDSIFHSPFEGSNINKKSAEMFFTLIKENVLDNIDPKRLAAIIVARTNQITGQ